MFPTCKTKCIIEILRFSNYYDELIANESLEMNRIDQAKKYKNLHFQNLKTINTQNYQNN